MGREEDMKAVQILEGSRGELRYRILSPGKVQLRTWNYRVIDWNSSFFCSCFLPSAAESESVLHFSRKIILDEKTSTKRQKYPFGRKLLPLCQVSSQHACPGKRNVSVLFFQNSKKRQLLPKLCGWGARKYYPEKMQLLSAGGRGSNIDIS